MENLTNFLAAVAASVVAYYICKWLDNRSKGMSLAALSQSGNRKGVLVLENLTNFLAAVAASVVAYYICKWLDNRSKGK